MFVGAVRMNRGWLGFESARSRALSFLMILEFTWLAGVVFCIWPPPWQVNNILFISMAVGVMVAVDRLNWFFLIRRGIGTRFEKVFERLSVTDRVWMYAFEAIFFLFCFAPAVYLAIREP